MRFILTLIFLILPLSAHANDIVVNLTGMSCQPCADTMEKKFSKEESVEQVSATFKPQQIIIDVKDGEQLSDEKIAEIINWGGYDLVEIKRN